MRLIADRHLHEVAVVAKDLVVSEDLGDGLVRRSDHQMSALPTALIELRPRQGRPATLAPNAAHHFGIRAEERFDRGFGRIGEEAMAVDSDLELVGRNACATTRLTVKFRERCEARRLAADDRNRQRQAERAGARDRLRRAAGRDPDGQRLLQRARIDTLAIERRPVAALPRDLRLGSE